MCPVLGIFPFVHSFAIPIYRVQRIRCEREDLLTASTYAFFTNLEDRRKWEVEKSPGPLANPEGHYSTHVAALYPYGRSPSLRRHGCHRTLQNDYRPRPHRAQHARAQRHAQTRAQVSFDTPNGPNPF
jgi:hypothetical protein